MPKGYHHLTHAQRCQIFYYHTRGVSQNNIASTLGISPSTISRELRRNRFDNQYYSWAAEGIARRRRSQASARIRRMTSDLLQKIEERLRRQWSPEQIAGRLKREFGLRISHERIYQHIWADKKQGGKLYEHLRHGAKRYRKRGSLKSGRGCIPNRVDIKERPPIVEHKTRLGDWEGDTIISVGRHGSLLSYVDRVSKVVVLEKLEMNRAAKVEKATLKRFRGSGLPMNTMTFDNGKEFSRHEKITKELGIACYFATPYRSWERGLNEHTNGLIRQYFPKSCDFSLITKQQVRQVEELLNNRPRKVLGFRTPKEVLLEFRASTPIALQC